MNARKIVKNIPQQLTYIHTFTFLLNGEHSPFNTPPVVKHIAIIGVRHRSENGTVGQEGKDM